jgi:hypothetical protein
MKDELTNECQKIAIEIFAQNGAPNNASTIAAAALIGEAFSKKIQERERAVGAGVDSCSRNYAREKLQEILTGYQESEAGVFEDIWSMLRQDSFLFRSMAFISDWGGEKEKQMTAIFKSLTTWSLAWLQYKKKDSL